MSFKSGPVFLLARFSTPVRILLGVLPSILLMLGYPYLPEMAYATPGIIVFPMVLITVWIGGFIPGFLSMLILSVFIITDIWAKAFQNLQFNSPTFIRTILFYFSCTLFILIISALQRSLERTRAALALRDEFVSIASHELRTPMTALYLQLEVLKSMHGDDQSSMQVIDVTHKHLQRLNRIINASLDLTMLDTGQLSINPARCNLVHIVEASIDSLRNHFADANTEVIVEASTTIMGHWDRTRIEQVVVNLLHNAIKYGKGNPINVRLGMTSSEATLSILDKGIGIADSEKNLIFERYQRGTTASSGQGIGLGLYLARSIVELHHGSIEVESKLGEGTTFTVKLPHQATVEPSA